MKGRARPASLIDQANTQAPKKGPAVLLALPIAMTKPLSEARWCMSTSWLIISPNEEKANVQDPSMSCGVGLCSVRISRCIHAIILCYNILCKTSSYITGNSIDSIYVLVSTML